MKVMLKCTYIFDPTETWGSYTQFEESMNRMLESIGLQAQPIKCMGEDDTRIIEISKKETPTIAENNISVKQQKYNVTKKRAFDGKFARIK